MRVWVCVEVEVVVVEEEEEEEEEEMKRGGQNVILMHSPKKVIKSMCNYRCVQTPLRSRRKSSQCGKHLLIQLQCRDCV